jgi:serine kinase of HPr protein (carbohydrate metabolism regulator)
MAAATIHASAVLIGAKAVLIRGPSGAGKSRLAFDLITAVAQGALPFARLVGDDRVYVEARNGRLLVRPAPQLAGLIEVRGLGIRRLAYEPVAAVGVIVDLGEPERVRIPAPQAQKTVLESIEIPRLLVAAGENALPLVLAWLRTTGAVD